MPNQHPPATRARAAELVPGRGPAALRVRLHSASAVRSVPSGRGGGTARRGAKQWQPPEGLSPEDARAVIAAAATERDRLLLRVLWATGARISEVLALRALDVRRDSLVLPNLKNPNRPVKRVFLPGSDTDLPGALLLFQREQGLGDDAPLFPSRTRGRDGRRRAITRTQAWRIVRAASERAQVHVLALRASHYGQVGEPAPVHPHVFRHARVRQIVRQTRSLPLAQRQAGWSRLQMAYLTIGDDEARELMRSVSG
jgi:integrase